MKKKLFSLLGLAALALVTGSAFVGSTPEHLDAKAAELRTIYVAPGELATGNAWFAAWTWGGTEADAWVTFADSGEHGILKSSIPNDRTGMKLYRMNPECTTPHLTTGVWNQSCDITIPAGKDLYTIEDWSFNGTWSVKPEYVEYAKDTQIFLEDAAGLTADNAWLAAYVFNSAGGNASLRFEPVEGEKNVYFIVLPDAASTIIFKRMNGETTDPSSWNEGNMYNKSADTYFVKDKNTFKITGYSDNRLVGEWLDTVHSDVELGLFTVTYYDGETELATKSSKTFEAFEAPTKENQIFVGWYLENTFETSISVGTTLSEDINVYAKYEATTTHTIFVYNTPNWTDMYLYLWGNNLLGSQDWPGVKMSNIEGTNFYYLDVVVTAQTDIDGAILNKGEGGYDLQQTVNLTLDSLDNQLIVPTEAPKEDYGKYRCDIVSTTLVVASIGEMDVPSLHSLCGTSGLKTSATPGIAAYTLTKTGYALDTTRVLSPEEKNAAFATLLLSVNVCSGASKAEYDALLKLANDEDIDLTYALPEYEYEGKSYGQTIGDRLNCMSVYVGNPAAGSNVMKLYKANNGMLIIVIVCASLIALTGVVLVIRKRHSVSK